MAKSRKRTHRQVSANAQKNGPGRPGESNRTPRSMVIRMGAGDIGPSVSQLTKDFRALMEPETASKLRERRSNKLRDYTTMAGPLGVTHMFLFSRSKTGNTHLRIALSPRGPTLQFRVEKYALCKDVIKGQKRPRAGGKEYLTAPLLVMNNFASSSTEVDTDPIKKQLESLTTTIFQSMFPPISPQTTSLSSIKRILLLNREKAGDGTYIISLRHYAITTRRTGVSRRIRRFDAAEQRIREKKGGPLPNLGKLEDMADYLLDPSAAGYTSGSETELDTDAEIEVMETVPQRVLNRHEREKILKSQEKAPTDSPSNVEKRAVKLVELGPRMRLRMVKVEEGLCEGRVMWNEFVTKSTIEQKELDAKWDRKRKEKEARKKQQKENVERKRQLKANTKANSGENGTVEQDPSEDEDEFWDSDELEDIDENEADNETMNGVIKDRQTNE